MGIKRKSGSRSFFSMLFKFSGRATRRHDYAEPAEARSRSKVFASDEDKGRYVGEPDIDRKATAFIARFHEARCTESEWQSVEP